MNHPAPADDPDLAADLLDVAVDEPSDSDSATTQTAAFVETFERVLGDPALPHLFFVDEAQTGCGATDTAGAHQQLGPEPDVVACGRKVQVRVPDQFTRRQSTNRDVGGRRPRLSWTHRIFRPIWTIGWTSAADSIAPTSGSRRITPHVV